MNIKLEEFNAEDIENNLISMNIKESNNMQSLRVVCYDMAGNIYDSEDDGEIVFTISSNAFTTAKSKLLNNINIFVIIIVVIAVLLISIVLFVVDSKRKNKHN